MDSSIVRMRDNWNARARANPFFYVESAHWDGDVEKFYALGEERAKLFIDPFLQARQQLMRGAAVEIGCGLGRFSRALAGRFAQVTALDVSDAMVEQARTLNSAVGNLAFQATDGVSMPVRSASADFVFSYEVFQHMPTHDVIKQNLADIARVLKPSGLGFIHFRTARDDDGIAAKLTSALPDSLIALAKKALNRDALTSDATWRGAASLSLNDIQSLCRAVGLSVIAFHEDPTHEKGTRIFAEVKRASA